MPDEHPSFDYIVVGAGSAGCVVASRLSEGGRFTVLLLDAGPDDTTMWSKIPLGFGKMIFNPRYMWFHESEPEPGLNNRRLALAQGKIVGGSSAVNGLVYMRGLPLDYALWRQLGAVGWSYEENLPYFRRSERYEGGDSALHGGSGPIGVEKARWVTPLSDAILQAGQTIGMARNDDFAGTSGEGIGYYDFTASNGRRASASEGYIKPARNRANLSIETEALVTRIVLSGRVATGVAYTQGDQLRHATARREIVLSAGAIKSPHLLQLSGIGPASLLRDQGIDVVHDAAGVGANLMDHVSVGLSYSTSSRDTINYRLGSPTRQMLAALGYFAGYRRGPMSVGAAQIGAMFRSSEDQTAPDIQMGMVPFLPDEKEVWKLGKTSGFRLAYYQLRPESRGDVRLISPDPATAPRIRFNHLSSPAEAESLLGATRVMRAMAAAAPLQAHHVIEIGESARLTDRADLLDYFRSTASTAFHLCGTARMGTDSTAVVDPELKVHGIERLRVVDASVMPSVVSGNTNAASLMIGERGADFILRAV